MGFRKLAPAGRPLQSRGFVVDRSGRHTAVIACAIAAGVVFGGGAVSAAPASADDRTEASGTVDGGLHGRTPARTEAPTPAPTRGRGPHNPVPPPPDPCPWPLPPPAAPPARTSQGGLVIGVPPMPSVTPVPIFGDRRIVGDVLTDGDFGISLPPPESPPVGGSVSGSAPTASGPAVPSALVAPSPVVPPAVPVVAAAPTGPPARSVPDLPAPGLVGPVPASSAAVPSAPRIPELPVHLPELRPDDLGRIASTALPGLAVLLGMTFLGGVVGYRQARAGYLLRAAGVGRFLQ